ncbi:MAG: acyl dehydratase, partial [Gammaproteobacteria bacterium]
MILNFSDVNRTSLKASSINVGDALPQVDIELTHTIVASTAIASMDFMPVHHDKDYALAQFAPDAFLNILSS